VAEIRDASDETAGPGERRSERSAGRARRPAGASWGRRDGAHRGAHELHYVASWAVK